MVEEKYNTEFHWQVRCLSTRLSSSSFMCTLPVRRLNGDGKRCKRRLQEEVGVCIGDACVDSRIGGRKGQVVGNIVVSYSCV